MAQSSLINTVYNRMTVLQFVFEIALRTADLNILDFRCAVFPLKCKSSTRKFTGEKNSSLKKHFESFQLIVYSTIVDLWTIYMWILIYKSTFVIQIFSTKPEIIHNRNTLQFLYFYQPIVTPFHHVWLNSCDMVQVVSPSPDTKNYFKQTNK